MLGFPVCIKDQKYPRNEFIFNFGIVVPSEYNIIPYEAVVRKMATTFTEMEVQNEYLSQEGRGEAQGRRPLGGLLEIIREDLNNYNECMIPVGWFHSLLLSNPLADKNDSDDSNTINMKLFPAHHDPPAVKSWHVPISKINFSDIIDDKWDLTMRKIIPEIDGISDVRLIAGRANVSLVLTKLALQHLLYHQTILLLDMFFFSNIYVPTPGISDFIADLDGMQEECARYVFVSGKKLANYYLCRLYTAFQHGRTLKDWLKLHAESGLDVLKFVDVRRLVQFGVIKGMLRRVKKFPVSKQYIAGLATGQSRIKEGGDGLQKYTDGCHGFDQIITECSMTDAEVTKRLSKLPVKDVEILYR
jgi:hypothetical protein